MRKADPAAALPLTFLIAALIAWITPFDIYYTAISGGSASGRVAVIVLLSLVGGLAAHDAGLRLAGHGPGNPLLAGLLGAVLIAAWVVALDCFVFRSRLSQGYVNFLRAPLSARLPYLMLRAYNENVIYRLFGFGCATWLVQRLRGERPSFAVLMLIAALVQMVNIGGNVVYLATTPATAATLGYDALRYVVPGVVWAGLFVRNGFIAAEIASVGCHLFLQPAFTLLLDR